MSVSTNSCASASSHGGKHGTLKQYCSILTYVEHNNRELYDTIHDLCMTGYFSMRGKRPLTFLMPAPGSKMHDEIVRSAYGSEPQKARDLIAASILTECAMNISDFRPNRQFANKLNPPRVLTVSTSTSKGATLDNGLQIIPAENFKPLYNDPCFSVYIITDGMTSLDTANAPQMELDRAGKKKPMGKRRQRKEEDQSEVSGGAWTALYASKNRDKYIDPRKLASKAVKKYLQSTQMAKNVPDWMGGEARHVFSRWAISTAKYLEQTNCPEAKYVSQCFHPNPMCIALFVCLYVNPDTYRQWLKMEDSGIADYSYAAYSKLIAKPKESDTSESVVKKCNDLVLAQKPMRDVVAEIRSAYKAAYGSDCERKLLFDEGVFLLNNFVRQCSSGRQDVKEISKIVFRHYFDRGNKSILTSCSESDMPDGAVYCKLMEFVLSESFMFPSKFGMNAPMLADDTEPRPSLSRDAPRGLNYSGRLAVHFR